MSGGDTMGRQWALLRMLPRYPQKLEASVARERLAGDGFEVTKRTVERDLQWLSGIFPIRLDDREKPYGWSWAKNAPVLDVPRLTASQALAFAMLEQQVAPLLPKGVIADLKAYFDNARQVLGSMPRARGVPAWSEKVRVVQPAQTLLPPAVDFKAREAIFEGLLKDQQVKIVYHKRLEPAPVEYTVNLLGLVQRGPVTRLVCTLWDYENVVQLALHRVRSALLLDTPAKRPKDFRLDEYVASGAIDVVEGEPIRLEVLFTRESAEHLQETPLSADQSIAAAQDGWVRVVATVPRTSQLIWWLRGFGPEIEVVAPEDLRAEFRENAELVAGRYGQG